MSFKDSLIKIFFKEYVSLDITASEVRLLSVRRNRIVKWGAESLKEGLVKDGIILEPQTVGLMIGNLFKSLQLSRDKVICTVTGLPFIYRVINMPETTGALDKEALERAARKEMSLNDPDMYLIWQLLESRAESKERDYFVIGVPRHVLKSISEALAVAGIKPYLLDVKPLALSRTVSSREALVVSREQNYVDVAVVSGGAVKVMHSFTLEGKSGDYRDKIMEIASGLSTAEKSYNMDYPQNPLPAETPVLLCGEPFAAEDALQLLQQISGHPVKPLSSPLELPQEVDPSRYAANLGLLSRILPRKKEESGESQYHDITLDLFVGVRRPSAFRFKESYAFVIMGVIIAAGLLVYAYTLRADAVRQVNDLKKQENSITAQLTAAQKANKDALAQKQTETGTLSSLQNQLNAINSEHQYITGLKVDYAGQYVTVTGAMPVLCDYQSLTLGKTTIHVTGTASSPVVVLSFAETLEQSKGITSVHINSISPAGGGSSSFDPTSYGQVSFDMDITE